jgi:hypothetical protein
MKATTTIDLLARPQLRSGVDISATEQGLSLLYRAQSADLSVEGVEQGELVSLLHGMKEGNHSVNELSSAHPSLRGSLPGLLEDLDRLGLLSQKDTSLPLDVVSGIDFYSEIRGLASRAMSKYCRSGLYGRMCNGTISRQTLIGYALEYYYIVRSAPGLVAPSLASLDTLANVRILQNFLASELNHDRMLADSLRAVGIDVESLEYMQPLPSTFSLCSALGVYARQHTLSFKASLFLFELPSNDFNEALLSACVSLGMPKGFYEPLVQHAHINDAYEHADVTRLLLERVSAISAEEQCVVRKNLVLMIETMALQESEILDYYGRTDAKIPRILS